MEFIIQKNEKDYNIQEEGRRIFTCDVSYDDKLLSLYLRNIYNDEALALYQIKNWQSAIRPSVALDFTIYEKETRMGELHKIKGGFEFDYQGVLYHFYGGIKNGVKTVLCFDRSEQCAQMHLEDELHVYFDNSTLGALMSLLCILIQECSLFERFSQDVFNEKYVEGFID